MSDKNKVINAYTKLPKEMTKEPKNPNFEDHMIKINKHCLVIGSTGSGKTNLLFDFLRRACKGQGTFGHITIITKAPEPLYDALLQKIPSDSIDIFYDLKTAPSIDSEYWDSKKTGVNLLVFDDQMAESKKAHETFILPYFLRGRKKGDGIQCWYLTQSYYQVPKSIRLQCAYIFLKKIGSNKDISMILRDQSLGLSKDEMLDIYKYALDGDTTNFLTIDLNEDDKKRFRRNWLEIIEI
jgi:hypothetical protein